MIITLKSMYPFLSMSNVRNTWSQNSSAFPDGKNILYMSTNLAGVSLPLGQSCCNTTTSFQLMFSHDIERSRMHIYIYTQLALIQLLASFARLAITLLWLELRERERQRLWVAVAFVVVGTGHSYIAFRAFGTDAITNLSFAPESFGRLSYARKADSPIPTLGSPRIRKSCSRNLCSPSLISLRR